MTKVVAVSMEVTYMPERIVNVVANLDTLRDDITVKVSYNDGKISTRTTRTIRSRLSNVEWARSEGQDKGRRFEDYYNGQRIERSEFIRKPR